MGWTIGSKKGGSRGPKYMNGQLLCKPRTPSGLGSFEIRALDELLQPALLDSASSESSCVCTVFFLDVKPENPYFTLRSGSEVNPRGVHPPTFSSNFGFISHMGSPKPFPLFCGYFFKESFLCG